MTILPREVAIAARNYQNNLSAPLAHDRGAPHTQLGHSVTQALGARLDQQVSPRCWLVTPSPRRHEAARGAHHAHAERAGRKVCGWGVAPCTAHPRVGSALDSFTWVLCSTVSACGALEPLVPTPGPQHKPYVRAGWVRVDRMACADHPRTRGFHTERLSQRSVKVLISVDFC